MSDTPSDRRTTFNRLHAGGRDPWNLETSAYELAKRDATIAALGARRFGRGLEVGCSIGTLTERLAELCDSLLALDVSDTALAYARTRLSRCSSVHLERREIPDAWPSGSYDLIVFSEVLYFLSVAEIHRTSRLAREALRVNGICLLVNWTGPSNLPVSGREAGAAFIAAASWRVEQIEEESHYQLHRLG